MIINYVEDEKDLADLMCKYLTKEGYEVKVFYDGETAEKHITDKADLWILDIMLPGQISGFELLEKIRHHDPEKLVIFTSARNSNIDKVLGLENGSDDYITKPYSGKELVLRVNNLLKHAKKISKSIHNYKEYQIDLEKRQVFLNGQEIFLTYKEFQLLEYLFKKMNSEVSREEIYNAIWSADEQSLRVVDDLLRRLRQKMPDLKIDTIYGFGYRLV